MLKDFCRVIDQNKYVVLDTETTGLKAGEICQIAVIDNDANVLVDTYIKTRDPIPAAATRIHGITDDMVKDAPTWMDLLPNLIVFLLDTQIVVFNAQYDRRMMYQSEAVWQKASVMWDNVGKWHCAMLAYAEFAGHWDSYHQSYTFQSLQSACERFKIPQGNAHTALADTLAARLVSLRLAALQRNPEN